MHTRLALAAIAAALLTTAPRAQAAVGDTELISVSSDPAHEILAAPASVSADGRYVAFSAREDVFAPGDSNGHEDCMVRDRGAAKTLVASRSSSGAQGNGDSRCGQLTEDGRYLVFTSAASNLVRGDTNGAPDVFVRNLQTGITERASSGSGTPYPAFPSISGDGRYVAFEAVGGTVVLDRLNATTRAIGGGQPKLSPDGRFVVYGNRGKVFVKDLVTGVRNRVDLNSDGTVANQNRGYGWGISRGGRYVLFTSSATNLVPGDTNDRADAFVRDLRLLTTERVSLRPDGTQLEASLLSAPSMSSDGRFVAFNTWIDHVLGHLALDDVYVRDRITGAVTLASLRSDGQLANDASLDPVLSAGGNFVIFSSWATNLSPLDPYGTQDVYLHELAAPAPTVSFTVTPETIDFMHVPVGAVSSPQDVTVTNTTSATLNLGWIGLAGTNAADFQRTRLCGSTLGAGATCKIRVAFAPTSAGPKVARLVVSTASGEKHSARLTGSGD